MSYQKIIDALNQELVCVDRAITFLMKAGGHDLASTNSAFHQAQAQPESPDRELELQFRTSAQRRVARRHEILGELREEQGLLVSAIESIHKLAESSGY